MVKLKNSDFIISCVAIICTATFLSFSSYGAPQKALAQEIQKENPSLMTDNLNYPDNIKELGANIAKLSPSAN